KTGEASGCAGKNGHAEAVAGDASRINPRAAGFHSNVVDQEAGFEIVCAVEKQIDAIEEFLRVARAEIGDNPFDGNGRIDGAKLALGGDRLGENVEGVGLIEEG